MSRDKRTKRAAESPANSSKLCKRPRKLKAKCFNQTFFEETLAAAGLYLENIEEDEASSHRLDSDPMKFVNNLKNNLEKNLEFSRNIVEFVKGFDKWTSGDQLSSLLLPNKIVKHSEDESGINETISQSVVRLFLGIRCLQVPIVKVLLDRITDFASQANPEKVQLLLKPFLYLGNLSPEAESVLVDGLSALLGSSNHVVRLEIIFWLPNLVTQQKSHSVALQLTKLLMQDSNLTPAVLDCLSSFSLSSDIKSQIEIEMLSTLPNMPIHFYPVFINYIFAKGTKDCNVETIRIIREKLIWNSENSSISDIESSQILTALSLKTALSRSKTLNLEWLKIINEVKESDDHNPLDVIILLIIYSIGNKEKVEKIFIKKIKSSLFLCSLINKCINIFLSIFKEHIIDCLSLLRSLLITKNEMIKELSMHWFVILFKNLPDSRKLIISELLHPEFKDNPDNLCDSITLLKKLADENLNSFQPFAIQIMLLINKIDDLNMKEVTMLMDFICRLTYGIDVLNLQDDVQMMIAKQLCSNEITVKIKGIVSAIMAVKHLVCLRNEKEPIDEAFSCIDDIPACAAKDAASIIQLILKRTLKFPELLLFFYDQFANMLNESKYIDGKFLFWMYMNFTQNFKEKYLISLETCDLSPIDGIELGIQYCLNEDDEVNEPMVLNIGNLVFRESKEKIELRILPSWFRVIQLIHLKCDNNLTRIDALLGCGVIMPTLDSDMDLKEFESINTQKILNCYVFCINWFREIISAFSSQKDSNITKKTLNRLSNLVLLEKKLVLNLSKITFEYKPPMSTFLIDKNKHPQFLLTKDTKPKKDSKKNKNSKKKTQNTSDASITQNTTLQSQNDALVANPQSVSESKLTLNKGVFRNISFDIIYLIGIDLCMENVLDSDIKINLSSLLFVLEEINSKVSQIFPSKTTRKSQIDECSSFQLLNPIKVLDQFFAVLPKLCNHIELIDEHFKELFESYDGVRDASGLFTDQNAVAQLCLSNIFQMFSNVFCWTGFSSHEHIDLFKNGMKQFVQIKSDAVVKSTALKDLILKTIFYILKFKDSCILISTAASMLKFIQNLSKFVNDKAVSEELMKISLEMLKQSWKNVYGDEEKGLIYNQHVNTLLSCHFSKPNMEMIKSVSSELCEQSSELSKKNFTLSTFQCINKSNFPLLFRSLCHGLYDVTKSKIDDRLTNREHLELWKDVTTVMKCLTDILKTIDNRSNLLVFSKQSIPLLKLFISQGMPIMSLKLKNDPDCVVEVLKMLQHSTRFLHQLYCHSKLKKDNTLISHLPQLKFVLETLIYKVKAALNANNCSEVFWMGNLKNKNLQGELILSQTSNETESDKEDELPEDDKSLSESDLDEQSSDDMKSVSNIF